MSERRPSQAARLRRVSVRLPEDYAADEVARLASATLTKRLGSPEDVARAVLFLCEGTDFATGSTLLLDGGRLLN